MSLLIPDDILQSAKMSEAELKLEIAIMLYLQRKLSTGKARRFAGMNLIEFQRELALPWNLHQLRCRRFSS